jgi:hypothetical protein
MCSPPRCLLHYDPASFIALFKADLNSVIVEEVVGLFFKVILCVVQGIEAPVAYLHLRSNNGDSEHQLFLPYNKFGTFHPAPLVHVSVTTSPHSPHDYTTLCFHTVLDCVRNLEGHVRIERSHFK